MSKRGCFGGTVCLHEHRSETCDATTRFAVYAPPQAAERPVPVLYYLAGLTSTEETFVIKGSAQCLAAKHGPMRVAPDKSPRGLGPPRGRQPNGSRMTDQTIVQDNGNYPAQQTAQKRSIHGVQHKPAMRDRLFDTVSGRSR